MANFFKTRYLVLNRQLLDASGNSLYLNGVEIGSLISGNLTLTGAALLSVIAQTGQAAWTHGQNNALNLSGSIASTGSQAWNAANNNAINLSGRDTAISGALEGRIALTGQAAWTHGQNNALNLSGNLTQSGVLLGLEIDALSGNLYLTGAALISRDNSISGGLEARILATGQLAWTHGQNNAINLSGNLFQTGSILNNRINSLSGWAAPASLYYVYTTGQQDIIGRKNFLTGISVSGDGLDFPHTGKPAYLEGRVFYDYDEHTLAYYNDADDITINIAQENVIRVKNTTSNIITNGMAVYVSGAQGMRPLIYPAIASNDEAVDRILGIATHDIPAGQNGYVTTLGLVHDLNLTGFLEGDEVFLSPTISGAYTSVAPDKPNLVVKLGVVLHNGQANGILYTNPETAESHLEYLHDVWIDNNSLVNGSLLTYDLTNGYWKNLPSFSGLLESGYRNSDASLSGNLYQTGSDLFNRDASISGGLEARIRATGQAAWTSSNGANIDISGRINASGRRAWDDAVNLSGRLASSGSILDTYIRSVSGNLISTGQTAQSNALNLSGSINASGRRAWDDAINLSGNLNASGRRAWDDAINLSGRLVASGLILNTYIGAVSGNLTQTGVLIGQEIDALSGVMNLLNGNAVWVTGTQIISGAKTISSNNTLIIGSGAVINIGNQGAIHGTYASIQVDNDGADTLNLFWNAYFDASTKVPVRKNSNGQGSARLQIGNDNQFQYYHAPGPSTGGSTISWGARKWGYDDAGFAINNNLIVSTAYFSGSTNLADIFATELELTLTGQHATNNALNLSGNLNASGRRAWDDAINLSGRLASTGSILNTFIVAVSGNLILTGQIGHNNALNLSGSLSQTGATLLSLINTANVTAANAVYTTGTQFISGTKYFIGSTYIDNLYVTGTQFIVNTQDMYVADNWIVLNSTGGARDSALFVSTGLTGLNATGAILGFDVPSNTWRFGLGSQQTDLLFLPRIASGEDIDSLNTRLIQTGYGLSVHIVTLSGNLTATGQIAQNNAINLSGNINATGRRAWDDAVNLSGNLNASGRRAWDDAINLSGRLVASGLILNTYIGAVSGNLIASGQHATNNALNLSGNLNATGRRAWDDATNLSGRLMVTGQTLINLINSVSGYNDAIFVHRTGNETITGIKNFIGNVGINVASPNMAFEVSGRQSFRSNTGPVMILQPDGDNIQPLYVYNQSGFIIARIVNSSNFGQFILRNSVSDTVFLTAGGDSYITGGALGIGITNPSQKFEVSGGSILIDNNSNTYGLLFPATSAATQSIKANGNDINASPYYDLIFAPTNSAGRLRPSSNNTSALGVSTQRWASLWVGNGTSSISGHVGFGTDAPTHSIHATGGIRTDLAFFSGTTNIADIFATELEIIATGRRAWDDAINLSGRLFATGALIADVSGGLQVQISSNDSDISTLSNRITSTGQGSRNDALNLSGNLNATGRRAWDDAINLSGRLLQTGLILDTYIDALSGNLITTGQHGTNNALNLSGRLTATGQSIMSALNAISGNVVWTTGAQLITGQKTFQGGIRISGYNTPNGRIFFDDTNGNYSAYVGVGAHIGTNDLYINNGSNGSIGYNAYVNGYHVFQVAGNEKMRIGNNGYLGIGTNAPQYNLHVTGSFAAASKSFVIPHPVHSGKYLQHGVVEGPEHSIFIRGRLVDSGIIQLPDYWAMMVAKNSITVQLTPVGKHQKLYVDNILTNKIIVKNENLLDKKIDCFYYVQGERTDIEKLKVIL